MNGFDIIYLVAVTNYVASYPTISDHGSSIIQISSVQQHQHTAAIIVQL